jgi:hypothetical protein
MDRIEKDDASNNGEDEVDGAETELSEENIQNNDS